MLITRAVTVRGVLFLRPPDTMTLSSFTVFDVVARGEGAVASQRSSSTESTSRDLPALPCSLIILTDSSASRVKGLRSDICGLPVRFFDQDDLLEKIGSPADPLDGVHQCVLVLDVQGPVVPH